MAYCADSRINIYWARLTGKLAMRILLVIATFLPHVCISQSANIVAVPADADAVVSSGLPTTNFGDLDRLGLGDDIDSKLLGVNSPSRIMRFLARFDPAAYLPAGIGSSDVVGAQLVLSRGQGFFGESYPISVSELASSFDQDSVAFDDKPRTGLQIGEVIYDSSSSKIRIDLELSTVKQWIDDPTTNKGIEVASQWLESRQRTLLVRSSDYRTEASRPQLLLELVSTPMPPPQVSISFVPLNQVHVSWSTSATAGFHFQHSSNLAADWEVIPDDLIEIDEAAGTGTATFKVGEGSHFFRLFKP